LNTPDPKVAILMSTYNGEKYLVEQLESIAAQTHKNWVLYVSDDGSSDSTIQILSKYQDEWSKHRLFIQQGPSKGFAANFLSLATNSKIHADFYAYSDQDDIFETNKLERAIKSLKEKSLLVPALYCSRTILINDLNKNIGESPNYKKPPSFENALTQNMASGNTMVFNNATRELLKRIKYPEEIVYHDWSTYLLVTGCGGTVYYDTVSTVRYRQHDDNQLGSNLGFWATFYRFILMLKGRFKQWNDINIKTMYNYKDVILEKNIQILDSYKKSRSGSLIKRILSFKRSKAHRQTFSGNLGLYIAVIFRKI